MKKDENDHDDRRAEYDLRGDVRAKYYERYRAVDETSCREAASRVIAIGSNPSKRGLRPAFSFTVSRGDFSTSGPQSS
jgi:hypothetical protein